MRWAPSLPAYFSASSTRGDEGETEATGTRELNSIRGPTDQKLKATSDADSSSGPERRHDEMHGNARAHQQKSSALTDSTAQIQPHFAVTDFNSNPNASESKVERATALATNRKEQAQSNVELQMAYTHIEKLQADLVEAQKQEQSKAGQLLQAEIENRHLKNCLDDCKEQIFKMQPIEHMTDAQIGEQYTSLCDAISDWTDKQYGELDNPIGGMNEMMYLQDAGHVIDRLLVRYGYLQIGSKGPAIGCTILTYFVHRYLHKTILHESIFLPGMRPAWQELISFVEHGMRNRKPVRDDDAIGRWMAEVQRVLLMSASVESQCSQNLTPRIGLLTEVLGGLLPRDGRTRLYADGLVNLIRESVSLASNIRLCPTRYRFNWRVQPADPAMPTALYMEDIGRFKFLDQANAQPLRGGHNIDPGPGGRIGKLLCVVHPELVRKGKNGGPDITLVKATILCEFENPVTRRRKAN